MARIQITHKRRTHGVAEPGTALARRFSSMCSCNAISESHELKQRCRGQS
jgi:hypothetical protein